LIAAQEIFTHRLFDEALHFLIVLDKICPQQSIRQGKE
jgi:hypothetical protein